MLHNILTIVGAALVPLVLGFIWYNPKVFGNVWMKAAGMNEEKMKGANMPVIFGVSTLLSFFLALSLIGIVIHQFHLNSIVMEEPGYQAKEAGSAAYIAVTSFMEAYGHHFRSFKHGVFSGILWGFNPQSNPMSCFKPEIRVCVLF